jgi:hypothetical protein
MRKLFLHFFFMIFISAAAPLSAQQDLFRWIDFHSAKDHDVVVWVTRSLDPEKWTAIREIGVQYDAALVVTALRSTPQSSPSADTFTVWNVSLTSHLVAPLVTGANLHLLDWMLFADGRPRELGALFDDCNDCQATTFFTAFHFDLPHHMWASRWMRGAQAVPLWSANTPQGATVTQVSALMAEPNGSEFVATWNHFDYGTLKDPEDFVYRYDLDPYSGLERMQQITGKQTEAIKQRLCSGPGAEPELARGQNSALCLATVKPHAERKPVTTPPGNNRGQSTSARH